MNRPMPRRIHQAEPTSGIEEGLVSMDMPSSCGMPRRQSLTRRPNLACPASAPTAKAPRRAYSMQTLAGCADGTLDIPGGISWCLHGVGSILSVLALPRLRSKAYMPASNTTVSVGNLGSFVPKSSPSSQRVRICTPYFGGFQSRWKQFSSLHFTVARVTELHGVTFRISVVPITASCAPPLQASQPLATMTPGELGARASQRVPTTRIPTRPTNTSYEVFVGLSLSFPTPTSTARSTEAPTDSHSSGQWPRSLDTAACQYVAVFRVRGKRAPDQQAPTLAPGEAAFGAIQKTQQADIEDSSPASLS